MVSSSFCIYLANSMKCLLYCDLCLGLFHLNPKKSLSTVLHRAWFISLLLAGATFCFYHMSTLVDWLHNTKHLKLKHSKKDQQALSHLMSVIESKLELKSCSCFTLPKTSFPVFIFWNRDSWCPPWFYSQFAPLIAGEHPFLVIGRATPDLPCWNK